MTKNVILRGLILHSQVPRDKECNTTGTEIKLLSVPPIDKIKVDGEGNKIIKVKVETELLVGGLERIRVKWYRRVVRVFRGNKITRKF